jgi:hypothetical protein
MRVDSHNFAAHSLLGDIYRDQNKIDEARQWYQMALDLDPDNRQLNAKLRETRAKPRRARPDPPPALPAPKKPISAALGTQNLMGLSPTHWFRIIWTICAVFVVAVISIVAWMRSHPRTTTFIPTGTVPSGPPSVGTIVSGDPRTVAGSVTGTIGSVSPAGSTSAAANPNDAAGSTTSAETSSSGDGNASGGPKLVAVAEREQALAQQLRRQGALPADASMESVKVDARGLVVSVSLLQRLAGEAPALEVRAAVARLGLIAAQTVFATDPSYANVTIEAKVAVREGPPQACFEGDVDRATAQRVDPTLRDEDRFRNIWWAAGMSNSQNVLTEPTSGGRL